MAGSFQLLTLLILLYSLGLIRIPHPMGKMAGGKKEYSPPTKSPTFPTLWDCSDSALVISLCNVVSKFKWHTRNMTNLSVIEYSSWGVFLWKLWGSQNPTNPTERLQNVSKHPELIEIYKVTSALTSIIKMLAIWLYVGLWDWSSHPLGGNGVPKLP